MRRHLSLSAITTSATRTKFIALFSLAVATKQLLTSQIFPLSSLPPYCNSLPLRRYIAPFALTLPRLAELGWLKKEKQGYFHTVAPQHWPEILEQPVTSTDSLANRAFGNLSVSQCWEVVRSLESISFVQPDLEVIIQTLWEQLATTKRTSSEPERRIFIHLDYILSETLQEHVDTLQEQIEKLWRDGDGGVISFNYSYRSASKKDKPIPITVYPCMLCTTLAEPSISALTALTH